MLPAEPIVVPVWAVPVWIPVHIYSEINAAVCRQILASDAGNVWPADARQESQAVRRPRSSL